MKPIAKMTKAERASVLKDPRAKLSDLLEIAALDAIALQRQKRVRFDMGVFVAPPNSYANPGNKCAVCLAGASLFRTGDVRDQGCYDGAYEFMMVRVNSARMGNSAVDAEDAILKQEVRPHINHKISRAPFRVYLKAAQKLREAGL